MGVRVRELVGNLRHQLGLGGGSFCGGGLCERFVWGGKSSGTFFSWGIFPGRIFGLSDGVWERKFFFMVEIWGGEC